MGEGALEAKAAPIGREGPAVGAPGGPVGGVQAPPGAKFSLYYIVSRISKALLRVWRSNTVRSLDGWHLREANTSPTIV